MNVFGLGVDTSLQCFIAAEEMGISEERGADYIGKGWYFNTRTSLPLCLHLPPVMASPSSHSSLFESWVKSLDSPKLQG